MRYPNPILYWLLLVAGGISGQTVSLSGSAKFLLEDDDGFKQPELDDSAWKTVQVPGSWNSYGLKDYERRTGWYRIRFDAPENIRNQACILFAGTIDDADETYLNGVRIGATGTFPPGDQSAWDTQRRYAVPRGLLQASNVLAVRVYNGILDGGIYRGKLELTTQKAYDRYVREKLASLRSYRQLTTSNGLAAAVYHEDSQTIEAFYPHIFSYHDSAEAVLPVLRNLGHNLKEKPLSTRYFRNTHIIEVRYKGLTLYYFCSFTRQDKTLYVLARGRKARVEKLAFHSEGDHNAVETGSWSRPFAGGQEKYFMFVCRDTAASGLTEPAKPENDLLAAETGFMRGVIERARLPKGIRRAERQTAEQCISILKMAQVGDKEVYPRAPGQILASLRPGVWAISWVRDAAYAIEALSKAGLYEEARKGLEFMLRASPTGQYVRYVHSDGVDYGVGVPYLISVTRYFGNGREESDYAGDTGPNIELDDFGLFLIAFSHYVEESRDTAFYRQWRDVIRERVVLPILHNLDPDHILRRDSGPWEHHLPGRQYAFTNAVCARGMQLFSRLEGNFDKPDAMLERNVSEMKAGINRRFLVEGRYFKGNAQESLETEHYYFDAATFELFGCGLIQDKTLFSSHMQVYDPHLRAARDPKRGYIRFDSQDSYENQEWPFAGLRVATAWSRYGERRLAKPLIDRITRFAGRNHHQIPEIIGLEEQDYKGAIPMVGYGAGAYLLALFAYYKS